MLTNADVCRRMLTYAASLSHKESRCAAEIVTTLPLLAYVSVRQRTSAYVSIRLTYAGSSLLYHCFTPALLLLQDARFAAEIAWVHAQLSRAYGGGGRCLILLALLVLKYKD